ncbi:MAG TPA: chorismate mutase, partial [Roseivirga sp.]
FNIIKQVGDYKREHNLAVYQPGRWQEVMESRINAGMKKNMTEKFMKSLLFAIHEESVKMQEAQLKEAKSSVKV